MRRALLMSLTCAGLLACGGKTNTPVTDQGVTLQPKSGTAAVSTVAFGPATVSFTAVVVADVDNLCGLLPSDPCAGSPTSPTMLSIAVASKASGDYAVSDPSAADSDASTFSGAVLQFASVGADGQQIADEAVSGTVHLDKAEAGSEVEGHYQVIMRSGAHLEGDFHGDPCPALQSLLDSSLSTQDDCASTNDNNNDGP